MQRLEVSGAVRPIYGSLGVKRLKQWMLKVKIKVKVKVTLVQATKAQRGSRVIAILFL